MSRLPWILLTVLLGGQLLAAAFLPKSISWDPSYGMLAAQQYVHGRSPNLWTIVEAAPTDLTMDHLRREPWWSVSYQVLPYAFRRTGLTWGVAISIVTTLCIAAGFAGWGLYFRSVVGSWTMAAWWLVGLACARYSLIATITYAGGDLLLWAATPWIVLLNTRALRQPSLLSALVSGMLSPSIVLLKFSAALGLIGLGGVWISWAVRRSVRRQIAGAWLVAAAVTFGLILANGFPAGPRPNSREVLQPVKAVQSLGLSVLGAFDLESMLYKLVSPVASDGVDQWAVALAGLALTAGLVVQLLRSRPQALAGMEVVSVVAIGMAAADIGGLAVAMFVDEPIEFQARLGRIAGLLILPLALQAPTSAGQNRKMLKPLLWLAVIILPSLYGVVAGGMKLAERVRVARFAAGADRVVAAPLSPTTDHDAFYRELNSKLPDERTLLVAAYPQLLFPIPSRRSIAIEMEAYSVDALRALRYQGLPSGGVGLLYPRSVKDTSFIEAIQRSFVDVRGWTPVVMDSDPKWMLWVGR